MPTRPHPIVHHLVHATLLAGLAFPLAGCERSSRGAGEASLLVKPNPLAVTFTADPRLAVSDRITAREGGQLTAVDFDRGLAYTLELPPDVLLFDETITMTPVSRVNGLPLSGGLAGAVRLEPSGLQLGGVATLRITKLDMRTGQPTGAPPGSPIGFAAEGDGSDFRLAPARTSDSAAVVHLTHFSLHGGAAGTPGEVSAQLQRAPASPAAQYEQQIAAIVGGTDAGTAPDVTEVHRAMYHDVVRPRLVRAAESDEALTAGYAALFSWYRQYLLLGGTEAADALHAEYEDGMTLMHDALEAAFRRLLGRCEGRGDLAAVSTLLRLARTAQLLGYEDTELDAIMGRFTEVVAMCTAFELTFHSRIDFVWKDGVTHSEDEVRATVPLGFDWTKQTVTGTGALEYVASSGVVNGDMGWGMGGCTLRLGGPLKPGTFEVIAVYVGRNPRSDATAKQDSAAVKDSIALLIDPGKPRNVGRAQNCKGIGQYAAGSVTEGEGWRASWTDQHRKEVMVIQEGKLREATGLEEDARQVWLIRGWQPGTGGALVEREYDAVLDNVVARVVERTRLAVRKRERP